MSAWKRARDSGSADADATVRSHSPSSDNSRSAHAVPSRGTTSPHSRSITAGGSSDASANTREASARSASRSSISGACAPKCRTSPSLLVATIVMPSPRCHSIETRLNP
ncbi:hypothetical protein COSO111634_07880 [Corallococcus soli]